MFNFFNKSNSSSNKYYFGLILREDDGVGMILEIDEVKNKIVIIDESKFNYSNSWERIVEDVDQVLSRLENQNKTKVEKVIYFVYSHMVSQTDKQIKPVYLNKIKRIAKELDLKPLGYIAYHEALVSYFRRLEESPLTSTIIELDKNSISLFVYKGGVITYSDEIASTANLIADLESAFNKVSLGNKAFLPSRMILYDSHNIEKESTKIITHHWNDNLFIQIPRVEVMTMDKIKSALINCFADQLFEASVMKNEINPNEYYQDEEDFEETEIKNTGIVKESFAPSETGSQDDVLIDEKNEEVKHVDDYQSVDVVDDDENMDFVEDPNSIKKEEKVIEGAGIVAGFAIGKDIRDKSQISNIKSQISNIENQESGYVSSRISNDNNFDNYDKNFLKPENGFEKMFSGVKSIFASFKIPNISNINFKNIGIVIPIIIGLVLIISAIFVYLYFFHKADVIINFESQKVEKEIDVSTLNFAEITKEITKTVEMVTTGKKTIGESAKGTIMISSLFNDEKVLKKGTVLATINSNIKYLLDSEVKIPSRSGSMLDGNVTPGKVRADVTAFDIGPGGNIEKGQKMKIEEFSTDDVVAVTESNFTGGIKKDIQTASLDDYARLRKEAETQIAAEASNSAQSNIDSSKIVPELTVIDTINEKFSSDIGSDAKTVTLTQTSNVKYQTYNDADVRKMITDVITPDIKPGFELRSENVNYQFIKASNKNDVIIAIIKANIKLMKKVDRTSLLKDLLFKNIKDVDSMVVKKYGAISTDVKSSSELFFFKDFLPLFAKNINLRLESK